MIEVAGDVTFSGFGMTGKSDRLFLSWQADELQLEGAVEVHCSPEPGGVEMAGENLRLKVNLSGPASRTMPPAGEEESPAARRYRRATSIRDQ